MLSAYPEIVVQAEPAPPDSAVPPVDVVVWDAGSWAESGLSTPVEVGEAASFITLLPDEHGVREALRAGARGVLLRGADAAHLQTAVMAVAEGSIVLDPSMLGALLEPSAVEAREPALHTGEQPVLTPRETEVISLMAEGLSNKLIAARLSISEHTAKFHVNAILDKLGAETRTEAVVLAARRGILLL